MEEGIIPTAPRKAFCPPDNCPSSQQCPRCRTNNRRLPRPVLPLPPLESALPQRRRAYNINRAYIPSTRLLSSQPIPSNPFLPACVETRILSAASSTPIDHPLLEPGRRKQLCHDFVSSSCCIHCKVMQLCYSRSGSSATK